MEFILEDKFNKEKLTEDDFNKICLSDIAQKWFLDTDFSDEFAEFIQKINKNYLNGDLKQDLDKEIEENLDTIFTKKEYKKWKHRILVSAYLKYLSNEKAEAQRLYSLYFDEESIQKMLVNIVRKSIYEYYVGQKYRIVEEEQTTNIFARNRETTKKEFSLDLLENIINTIEEKWVAG